MNEGIADDMGIESGNVVRVRELYMHGAFYFVSSLHKNIQN